MHKNVFYMRKYDRRSKNHVNMCRNVGYSPLALSLVPSFTLGEMSAFDA